MWSGFSENCLEYQMVRKNYVKNTNFLFFILNLLINNSQSNSSEK